MVVFLGSYYLLNLMLAVVAMSYEAEAQSSEQVSISIPVEEALFMSIFSKKLINTEARIT
jgi:hypothetical protein